MPPGASNAELPTPAAVGLPERGSQPPHDACRELDVDWLPALRRPVVGGGIGVDPRIVSAIGLVSQHSMAALVGIPGDCRCNFALLLLLLQRLWLRLQLLKLLLRLLLLVG